MTALHTSLFFYFYTDTVDTMRHCGETPGFLRVFFGRFWPDSFDTMRHFGAEMCAVAVRFLSPSLAYARLAESGHWHG